MKVTHQAQQFIDNSLFTTGLSVSTIEGYSLSSAEASALKSHLKNDALSYIYSSIVSVGDATLGIRKEMLTWATVKLYYATFYALRSLLAVNGTCIFYYRRPSNKNTPFILSAQPGQMPKKASSGQTHKLVLSEFKKRNFEPRLLSQLIGVQEPLDWLVEKREEANYRIAKFSEPYIPKHFEKIIDSGFRRSIREYLCDTSDLYTFDPDHAILAYPLRVIQTAYKQLLISGDFSLKNDEVSYLCKLFTDQNGPIPEIHNLFKNP